MGICWTTSPTLATPGCCIVIVSGAITVRKPGLVEMLIGRGIDSAGSMRCCMVVVERAEDMGEEELTAEPEEPEEAEAWAVEEIKTEPLERPEVEVIELKADEGLTRVIAAGAGPLAGEGAELAAGAEEAAEDTGAELAAELAADSFDSSDKALLDLSSSEMAFDKEGIELPKVVVDDLPAVKTL